MGNKIKQQGYAYWIPAKLVESGDHLKALLYGLIYSLSDENGMCWASSEYLAKKLGRKDRTIISGKLQELLKEGWLSIKNPTNKNREIYLTVGNNQQIPLEKTNGQPLEITNESNISQSNKNEYSKKKKRIFTDKTELKEFFWQHELFAKLKTKYPDRDYDFQFEKMCAWYLDKKKRLPQLITAFGNWLEGSPVDPTIQAERQRKILREAQEKQHKDLASTPRASQEKVDAIRAGMKNIGKSF